LQQQYQHQHKQHLLINKRRRETKIVENGNTITIQKCKQAATQSGWDNNQAQGLSSTGITILLASEGFTSLEQLCAVLPTLTTEAELLNFLVSNPAEFGLSESQAIQLIQCLKDAGVVFKTT
jgi:hypothetical protein